MHPYICSIDIFVDLQPLSCNLKGRFFEPPRVWGVMGRGGSGMNPFDSPPMGSYWLPIDTCVSVRPSVRPSDPDTMTIPLYNILLCRVEPLLEIPIAHTRGWFLADKNCHVLFLGV